MMTAGRGAGQRTGRMGGATRIERDSMGVVEVPRDRLWGAQTQRSLLNFPIGGHRMPIEVVRALARIKGAAARVNRDLGLLDPAKAAAIEAAAREVVEDHHDDEFPLVVWQTGSGTQTNMNVNEVIANLASERLGVPRGEDGGMLDGPDRSRPVHPNDDVNMGQSSNDVFPTAMHLAALEALEGRLIPAVRGLRDALDDKARAFADIVKIGRTHLMDATPLTLGQEFSGYAALMDRAVERLAAARDALCVVALGGTAVGTGLGAHPEFAARVCEDLARETGFPIRPASNLFEALSAAEPFVTAHGALKSLAASLMKVANDIRWLASGPRCGIGEVRLPANEPGSSIMPGKVNPTQAEAVMMVAVRVMGNDVVVGLAGSQGNFELNVMRPVMIHAFLESAGLMADACRSFTARCVAGIEPDLDRIRAHLERSLMLVTALAPRIGYDQAARIARRAHETGSTLRDAALELGLLTADEFDDLVRPEDMIRPGRR